MSAVEGVAIKFRVACTACMCFSKINYLHHHAEVRLSMLLPTIEFRVLIKKVKHLCSNILK